MRLRMILACTALCGSLHGLQSLMARVSAIPLHMRLVDTPAAAGSSVPRLTKGNQSVYLSWVEPSAKGHAVRFASWQENRWSAVRTVADGAEVLAAASSEPGVLELPGGAIVAQWLTKAKENEANHILVAVSRNGGVSWTAPVIPYRDSTPGEHMYVSLFAWPAGGAGIVWLDPRGGKDTSLMQTTIDLSGKLGPERALDADVCSCCPTSAASTAVGPLLLYRGRTATEIRDMHVTLLQQGTWQAAHLVHADNWKINGCPTNSGAIAAQDRDVAAAWYTASGHKQVDLAFSKDAGRSFSKPTIIDDAAPLGRASVTLLPDGSALTSWIASGPQGSILSVRRANGSSQPLPVLKIAQIASGQKFGFPFIAAVKDKALVVWTVWDGDRARGIQAAIVSNE